MSKLSERAMLVGLTIQGWQARKYDKRVSAEVEKAHLAKSGTGRFTKHLFGDAPSYEAVTKQSGAMRQFFYEQTLPWSKDGQRILPTKNYEAFSEGMRNHKRRYFLLVDAFIADYPLLKEQAKMNLGELYLEGDYPRVEEMQSKFDVILETLPLPSAEDFRAQLADEEVKQIQRQIERRVADEVEAANQDLWRRLRDCVDNMIIRLGNPEGRFHDTLVSNLSDVVALIPRLNFTGDEKLEEIRQKCESSLIKYPPQVLRDITSTRNAVAEQAIEISKLMDAYM